ncbi:hypothetical protein PSN45_000349 [Yamadazyma tenuis]|nr:hypothetical protein PSN45_000349 [Yamadazyma tenuis]
MISLKGSSPPGNSRNIFSKLLHRRSSTSSPIGPHSSSSTRASADISVQRSRSKRSDRSVSRTHSVRKADRSVVDDNDSLRSDETFNENDESDVSSVYSNLHHTGSTTFSEPLPGSSETSFEDVDRKLNELLVSGPAISESPWQGFNRDALNPPKYVKVMRRNKGSPKTVRRIFLAQELNDESDSDSVLDESPATSNMDLDGDAAANLDKAGEKPAEVDSSLSKEVFSMLFSRDGKYLAIAGRDSVIKVYKVLSSPLGRMEYQNHEEAHSKNKKKSKSQDEVYPYAPVFHQKPVRVFKGHTKSVLSIDWSKNNFLLSGSMDKTVKLWHVDRADCLATFQHEDFVTTVKFHPNDDRFFLSGSLDNYARLWSILEGSVAYGRNLGDEMLITASCFTPDGLHCLFGGFNGTIAMLETKGLHIIHSFDIKPGMPSLKPKTGKKVTSIQALVNEAHQDDDDLKYKWTYLITTNDSRIRLINANEKKLVTRFKGVTNTTSVEASISDDCRYILAGSEDHWCYVWENNNAIINNKLKSAVSEMLNGKRHLITDLESKHKKYYDFIIKNKLLKKLNAEQFLKDDQHSEFIANENSSYTSFHAHHSSVNAAIFAPSLTKKLLELSDDVVFDMIKRGRNCASADEFPKVNIPDQHEIDTGIAGFIMVTTDETGLIRVFRQDVAYDLRKGIIDYYKKSTRKECPTLTKSSRIVTKVKSPALSPSSSMSSVPNLVKHEPYLSTKRFDSRPPSKSISNGILNSQNGTFKIKSDAVIFEQNSQRIASSGVITPDYEPEVPFPSIKNSDSRSSVPLFVNTAVDSQTPEVMQFQTPVTSAPKTTTFKS